MRLSSLPTKESSLFILFSLSILSLGWLFFILALFNFFVFPVIFIGTLFLGLSSLFFLGRLLMHAPRSSIFTVGLLALISFGNLLFTTPTLLSGRDQGAISEAAIRLSESSVLTYRTPATDTFFDIYGPGKALNFPGFAYTDTGDVITQFPLVYTSFLAAFHSLFGIAGLTIANGLLLFLFLFTFFELLRLFVKPFYASLGSLLAGLSFLPLWFSQFTLTENLAVFLFTLICYSLLRFLAEPKFTHYIAIFLASSLLMFTRIEGYVFFVIIFLFLLTQKQTRALISTYRFKALIVPGLFLVFIFLRNFFINLPYYKTIGRALEKFLTGFGSTILSSDNGSTLSGQFPVGGVLILYGVLPLFLCGILGYFIIWRQKHWRAFIPLLVALPTLLYLFMPNITLDHPWMLRRYYFTLYPLFVFSAVVGFSLLLAKTRQAKVFFSLFILILIGFSLPAHITLNSAREDKTLLPQIEKFSRGFSSQSLILVDRNATGSGYALPTAPLNLFYQRQAVYFFNPEDIAQIDFTRFDQVYLIAPENELPRYIEKFGERMIYQGSYTFTRDGLAERSLLDNNDFSFPQKKRFETKDLIFQVY
ncbi:MAG: hypothetical protein KIH67_003560 [Candidatus Moranbacteria bacterium]|nr:hypothetical protein [Candidatus Moranbacteria bacterium]